MIVTKKSGEQIKLGSGEEVKSSEPLKFGYGHRLQISEEKESKKSTTNKEVK